jgi:hypothetical protein
VHRRAGQRNRALGALRDGRAVMQQLLSRSPDLAGWKRDLAWFDGQVAVLEKSAPVAGGPARPAVIWAASAVAMAPSSATIL